MAKVKAPDSSSSSRRKGPPALTPKARENQLISLAIDVAEEQLLNRTASSQVITHFLKLATTKAELEKEKLKLDNELTAAKTKALASTERIEELYKDAIDAMKRYGGHGGGNDEDPDIF